MPGLDPGIHQPSQEALSKKMDGRVKPGHDEKEEAQIASSRALLAMTTCL
jgi:hypothetical protein